MEEVLNIERFNKIKMQKILKKLLFQVIIMLLIITIVGNPIYYIIKLLFESVESMPIIPYSASNTTNINDDGTFSTTISAQELWDNLIDQGVDLEKYLDTPEELATLVNAQNVMQLPDISSNFNDSNNNNEANKLNALATTDNNNSETNGNGSNAVIEAAKTQLGQPYSYIGSHADPKPPQGGGTGFNCSGLVWWAFEQAGYQVSHSQCAYGTAKPNRGMIDTVYSNCGGRLITNPSELHPGDVLFYNTGDGRESGHVAIYMGNNQRIHANGTAVVIDSNAFNAKFIGGGPLVNGIASTLSTTSGIVNDSLHGIIRFRRHDQDGDEYYLTYSDPTTFQNQIELYNKSGSVSAREFVMTHFTLKENPMKAVSGTIYGTGSFTKYNLSDSQLNTLARICLREQGSAKGAAAEASLMANLFELSGGSFGSGADGLYNYVMTSGWFGIPGDHNAPSSVDNEVLTAVKAVLMQGYRTLPKYVNEHDCINPPDIIDPPARREDFIPFQTVLHNIYGSTYTFYCFPTEDSDPFGYTSEANRQKFGDFCYEYGSWQPLNGTEDTSMDDVKATGETSGSTSSSTTDSTADVSSKIVNAAKNTPTTVSGHCLEWVDNVYHNSGVGVERLCCAYNAFLKHGVSTDLSNIPVGAAIYGTGSGRYTCGSCGNSCGHVGIYIGNGKVMHSIGYVETISLTEWGKRYNVATVNGKKGILGWGWEDGNKTRGASGVSGTSATTPPANYTGQLDNSQSGDGYAAVYTSSSGLTYRNYKQYEGSYSRNKFRYSDIWNCGCFPTSISILASGLGHEDLTPGVVADKIQPSSPTSYDFNDKGMNLMSELGWNPEQLGAISGSEMISKLKEGKVFIIYSNGHPIQGAPHFSTVVDVNESTGEVFILNPGAADQGRYISGQWYSANKLASEAPGFSVISIDSGNAPRNTSTSGASDEDSSAPGYQAVVGTFTEIDKYVSTEGRDVEAAAEKLGVSLDTEPQYTLSTTIVNYEDLVQPYVMKFDFLCALLVISQNKDFVIDIAKLAYKSDLEVSIYDTITTTTDVDNYTYIRATDAQIVGNATFNGCTASFTDNHYYSEGNPYLQSDGFINRKVVTRTDTVQYALTRANTWYIDYKQSYEQNENKGSTSYGGGAIDNIVLEGWHKADLSDHRCEVIVEAIQKVIQSANADLKRAYTSEKRLTPDLPEPELYSYDENKGSVIVNYIKQKARTQLVNINHSTEDTTDITTYTPGTKEAVFKDCNKKELSPNFVTLYNSAKYRSVRNTMEISWLIEIMEANENLANITQIFKYLWYKATNQNLGVTELDVTSYYPGALQSIGGQSLSGEAYVGASAVISRALSKEGYPYQINTQGPNTFDCSGFVSYALSGKYIRYTNDVIISWPHIDISEAKPGDVVVICNSSPPNYSGRHSALIYDNDLNIIEAVPDRIVKGSRNARDMVNRGYVIVRPPSNVINPNP